MIWNRPPAFFLFSYSIIQFILYKLLCLDPLTLPPFVFSRSEMTWYLSHNILLSTAVSVLSILYLPVSCSWLFFLWGEKGLWRREGWLRERERVKWWSVVFSLWLCRLQSAVKSTVLRESAGGLWAHLWLQACGAHSLHMETKWESEESIITYYQ